MEDEQNYLWHTNWLLVLKEKNCAIGGIMLKGIPSEQEEVVIGYYTLPPYMGQGYMTESIIALKNWLLHQPNVKYVIADTETDNMASHRVLEKAGANLYKVTKSLYFGGFNFNKRQKAIIVPFVFLSIFLTATTRLTKTMAPAVSTSTS